MTDNWQAMGSAPRDTTPILLRWSNTVTEGRWQIPYQGARDDHCFWRTAAAGDVRAETPTEWMPLPLPPAGDGWRDINTAPKDGATVEVRGVMRVHRMQGCKFPTMPKDWRPDTPQTEWRLTGWREIAPSTDTQAALAKAEGLASHEAT